MKIDRRKLYAETLGALTYEGNPCKRLGHTIRYVSTGHCVTCSQIYWEPKYKRSDKAKITRYRSHLRSVFNLTEDQYIEMYKAQNGLCAICFKPESIQKANGKLSIDHCHTTNRIRKLLCNNCNTVLGRVFENVTILQNMINYILQYENNSR